MFESLKSVLAEGTGQAVMGITGIAAALTFFVGVTLFVALFHPRTADRRHAREILRDLLTLFGFTGRDR